MKSSEKSRRFLEEKRPFKVTESALSPTVALSALDQIAALATLSTNTSTAFVKTLDDDQLILCVRVGDSLQKAVANNTLCFHTLEQRQMLTFHNLTELPEWSNHPLVTGPEAIKSYAGVPLLNGHGQPIGVLAVMDQAAKEFSAEQRQSLMTLSSLAVRIIESTKKTDTLSRTERELNNFREAHNKSEAFYHSLVESLPQNIIRKDLEGRFTFANQNFCQALGKPLEEIIGKTDFDFFPFKLAKKYQKDDRTVVETGQRFETVEEHQTASREQSFVQVMKTPVYNTDGQIVGIQAIFWDVTEQRKTEKDLAFERDLLRSLLDSIPDHVYFKDQSSRFIICSKELSDRLGLKSPEEAIGKTDFDFFSKEHAQPAYDDEQTIISTGKPVISKIEKEILLDGRENWVLTSKMPFRSAGGAIIGTFGVSKDITSLVKTRQELEQAQKKYQDIFEKAVEGIFQTTPDGRYLEANPALARIYGYDSAHDLLTQVTDIGNQLYVDQRRRKEFQRLMDKKGEVHEFESEIYRRDGTKIWIAETARAVRDESNQVKYYEGIVENISERKRAEAALQMARDAALESTRLKSIFLANMSHEIRTPMNGIIGMTGLLRRTKLNEEQLHFAKTIEESGLTLLRLINDILDFSKMESGKMTLEKAAFDPTMVVESVAELLAENAQKKGIELILWIDPSTPRQLVGDATRLRQILNNLTGNAIKFTSEGEVQIIVRPGRSKGKKAPLRIEVRDTGIGIAPEAKRHVFKAFTQADESTTRKFGGTGLGLAISRQLIELMGGRLQVESEPGTGSRFWFTLPLTPCKSSVEESRPPVNKLDGARILIVDDNKTVCKVIKHMLTPYGVHATILNSASQTRRLMEKRQPDAPPIDYMIIDWDISGNRGLKLCSTVHSLPQGRRIRKLLLTPVGKKIPNQRLAECGINCLITKPVRRHQLLQCLERARLGEKAGNGSTYGIHPESQPPIQEHTTSSFKILVVEDNPVNQSVAIHVLRQLGYEGIAISNGLEAIAILNQSSFPVILMDCQMPELDGYETTKRIREMEAKTPNRKRTRIIAMTANDMEGDRQKCLGAGMDDYISKPVMLPDVEAALSAITLERPAPVNDAPPEADVPRLDPKVLANFRKLDPNSSYAPLGGLAELFSKEIPRQVQAIQAAIDAGNQKELNRIAHTFKGSANNIGARRLAAHCLQLESAELTSPSSIKQALAAIKKEADAVLNELVEKVAALSSK
ncbi:MAG: Signal transduction histidine-protein kinase BarA [Verrucomicrobia subdivision 3 bacterium]|nr:Signal transduction histidine-protein kinase BarA [Limisphaerales bacterium]MCS1415285.1 Signal transduction histidine-protein kinase BarA [Limisphaerales bacterium]